MSDRGDFWSQHLAAIEREGITAKAYAEREGLSVGALYQWRRELKAHAPHCAGEGFVAVELEQPAHTERCLLRLSGGVVLELSELPGPNWLAALSAALAQAVRCCIRAVASTRCICIVARSISGNRSAGSRRWSRRA